MKKRALILIISGILLVFAVLAVFLFFIPLLHQMRAETQKLELVSYPISSEKLPKEFSGFRIAQVADLHNTEFGEDNERLLTLLEEAQPDVILFTGDTIDSRQLKLDVAVDFVSQAMQIAPCYFVNGNHEASVPERVSFHEQLRDLGVVILEDEKLPLDYNGASITLIGLEDPSLSCDYYNLGAKGVVKDVLQELTSDTQGYTLLLAHHPEWIDIYRECGIDLVLSGHTHGGQIRSERFGALIAPGQGFFPEYDRGLFREGDTTMIISSGLGNSTAPLRYNNPPELVIIEFE